MIDLTPGDNHYEMKVGAASKGIIQRDFQHHATVYKSPYAKVFDKRTGLYPPVIFYSYECILDIL